MNELKNTWLNWNPSRLNPWDFFQKRQFQQLLQRIVMLSEVADEKSNS
jgi:hypothetical protein